LAGLVVENAFTALESESVDVGVPIARRLGAGSAGLAAAVGAPHVAQNFADPISSALHFAQFAMDSSMLGHLARRHK
jgi:hypothetical protein